MSYIVESEASTARRSRRRRAAITLVLVVLMLFFAFWYAYSYYRADGSTGPAPTPSCTTTAPVPTPLPRAAQVSVNVFNATDRNGLAARTAAEIRKRGFRVIAVANDPLERPVTGPAEVRFGPDGERAAQVVLALVKGAKAVPDARTDASVDLVLGQKFVALAPPAPARAPGANPTTQPGRAAPAASPSGATKPSVAGSSTAPC